MLPVSPSLPSLLPGGYSTGYAHDPEEKAKYTDADNANFNP